MSSPDYELHLDRDKFKTLFDDDNEYGCPFEEDLEDIELAITEELGVARKRKKAKK